MSLILGILLGLGIYFLISKLAHRKPKEPKHVHDWGPWYQEHAKVHGKTMFGPMQTIDTTVQCRTCKTCGYTYIQDPF